MSKINNTLKLALAATALAAVGVASAASTAPVGEGYGAAANYLSASASTLSRAQVQTGTSTAPVGEGYGAIARPASTARTLTRAEVQADLNLWNKAGLAELASREDQGFSDPRYNERVAVYQQLRNGPAYQAEVRRLGGATSDYAAQGTVGNVH